MAARSSLLGLPGELRNRIHRNALLTDDSDVIVDANGVPEPALLLTCKQIRAEGAQIYYSESDFMIHVPDYDTAVVLKWTRRLVLIRENYRIYAKSGTLILSYPQPHWVNLVTWLERLFNEEVFLRPYPPSQAPAGTSTELLIIGGMFALVQAIRGQPRSRVKTLLDEQHDILISIDKQWE
ncbi:hypothetical protein LTR37_013032 [Vermiconidia calcicola]|uniref:Uncharacterized protein n=1 Tax=Vermiconidia calcicola TaxID=1690605 RepID=A0ACC3MYY0_9PEZI|nr:hypothetical protein LTR37_013032 [Vermiconidia calcicola]